MGPKDYLKAGPEGVQEDCPLCIRMDYTADPKQIWHLPPLDSAFCTWSTEKSRIGMNKTDYGRLSYAEAFL